MGGRRMRERDRLLAEPGAQVIDERVTALLPDLAALVGAQTLNLALYGKERVDALHRFQSNRRYGRSAGRRALAAMSASTKKPRRARGTDFISLFGHPASWSPTSSPGSLPPLPGHADARERRLKTKA